MVLVHDYRNLTKKILPFLQLLFSYFSYLGTTYHTGQTMQLITTVFFLNEMRVKQLIFHVTLFNFKY